MTASGVKRDRPHRAPDSAALFQPSVGQPPTVVAVEAVTDRAELANLPGWHMPIPFAVLPDDADPPVGLTVWKHSWTEPWDPAQNVTTNLFLAEFRGVGWAMSRQRSTEHLVKHYRVPLGFVSFHADYAHWHPSLTAWISHLTFDPDAMSTVLHHLSLTDPDRAHAEAVLYALRLPHNAATAANRIHQPPATP